MRNLLLLSLLVVLLFSSSFREDTNPLLGRWEWSHVYKEGPVTILAVFKANGVYDGFANKKAFVSGTYKVKNDTLYISDAICNSKYQGTYKLKFFGNRDSVKFDVLQDTCSGRKQGIDGTVYKHIKASK